jgi:hypothetical protein
MYDLNNTLEDALKFFPAFAFPIYIEWKTFKHVAEWRADFIEYGEKVIPCHGIFINSKKVLNQADLLGSICHELIHAWQWENKVEIGHGVEFCEWCLKLETVGINAYSNECELETVELAKAALLEKSAKYFGGLKKC